MPTDPTQAEDDKQYLVKLRKPVILPGPTELGPLTENLIKGKILKTFPADAILSYEET